MDAAIRKAETLIEALGYIRTFRDKVTVIKLGGSAMESPDALRATLQDVVFMETVGMRPVLVHGGGAAIDRAMDQAGLKPRKVLGRRYTDEATLAVVIRVLLHEINADIVRQVRHPGGRGHAPAGREAGLSYRHARHPPEPRRPVLPAERPGRGPLPRVDRRRRHRRGDDPQGGGVPGEPAGRGAQDPRHRRADQPLAPFGDL